MYAKLVFNNFLIIYFNIFQSLAHLVYKDLFLFFQSWSNQDIFSIKGKGYGV